MRLPHGRKAGGKTAPHRYWRVRVELNNGESYVRIGELAFKKAPGGPNLCGGGTILFSNQFASSGDNSAAAAFDGTALTATAMLPPNGGTASGCWLGYQLPAPSVVTVVEITSRNDATYGPNGAPKNFTVQYSDNGAQWFDALSVVNQTAWGAAGEKRAFVWS